MRVTERDNPRLEYLREKTLKLTTSPGCYIMKNKAGTIIYIGKAKNLRNRVSTYFHDNDHLPKVAKMVSNVYVLLSGSSCFVPFHVLDISVYHRVRL